MKPETAKSELLGIYLDGLEQLFEATLDKGQEMGFGEDFYVECINRSEMNHVRMIATWAVTNWQTADEPDAEYIRSFIDNCVTDFRLNLQYVLEKAAKRGFIADLFDPNAELRNELLKESDDATA